MALMVLPEIGVSFFAKKEAESCVFLDIDIKDLLILTKTFEYMKREKLVMLAVALAGVLCGNVCAQASSIDEQKAVIKERKEMAKLTQKQVKSNVWKDAKKMAKQLKKEGWKPFPGSPSLEIQQNDMMLRRYELQGEFPRYFLGQGNANANTTGMARKQASARARVELASNISTEISSLTETEESNTEISRTDKETIGKMLSTSQALVQQSLGRTDIVFEAYREKENNTEVMVWVCCDGKAARSAILSMFDEDQKELRERFERLLEEKSK